jgi:hypothetical protein
MRVAAIIALLALGGCSWFRSDEPKVVEETRPEYLACRQEVQNSPEMQRLAAQSNPENAVNVTRLRPVRAATENRLYRDCLRSHGLTLPGGVETVRPRP